MLVFMGGFGAWAQVLSKGSCVGKVGVTGPIPVVSSRYKNPLFIGILAILKGFIFLNFYLKLIKFYGAKSIFGLESKEGFFL